MSYQVLARKWRPAGFDDVTGQGHVTQPLRNAVRSGRVPHAILLTGPRGVGKTTLARILARCLNCEKGPTDEPCGSCTSCTEIAGGSSTDVQEIDAASRTGVDDVREIIESVRYAPSPGKHRIYVVDEVHMLSTAAFNALLKTLEEPPPRSLFVFATTNPEKIPFTVVSRCQRYDLRRIATTDVAERLREVARAEGVKLSDPSLLAIARAGEGSLRDALTLLDQVLAAGGESVDDARVAEVLDLIDRRLLLDVAEACVDGDPQAALRACRRADEAGVDARRLGGELIRIWRDLVVLRVAPDAGLVDAADADLEALGEVASRAGAPRLRRMFRALVRELEDVAWAPEPFAVLEMALVRLATLPEDEDVAALIGRLDALERRLSGGPPDEPAPTGGAPGGGSAAPRGRGRSGGKSKGAANAAAGPLVAASNAAADPIAAASNAAAGPLADASGAAAGPLAAASSAAAGSIATASDAAAGRPQDTGRGAGDSTGGEPRGAVASEAGPRDVEPRTPAPPTAEPGSLAGQPGALAGQPGASPLPAEASPEQVFDRLRTFAQQQNRGLFAALEGARLVERSESGLRIALEPGLAAQRLEGRGADLEAVCERFFGRPTRVAFEVLGHEGTGPGAGQPGRGPGSDEDEMARRRRNEALDHPAVNAALEILEGEILEIRPLGGTQ